MPAASLHWQCRHRRRSPAAVADAVRHCAGAVDEPLAATAERATHRYHSVQSHTPGPDLASAAHERKDAEARETNLRPDKTRSSTIRPNQPGECRIFQIL